MWERNTNLLPSVCTRPGIIHTWTRDQTHNPGMCPYQQLTLQPFGYRMVLQPTEPHWPGLYCYFSISSVHCLLTLYLGGWGFSSLSHNPDSLAFYFPFLFSSIFSGRISPIYLPVLCWVIYLFHHMSTSEKLFYLPFELNTQFMFHILFHECNVFFLLEGINQWVFIF